eukprot:7813480-Alexandrium_andersonii.AAC.1
MKGIGSWIPRVIAFEDWSMPSQDQYEFWLMFGLPHPLVEVLQDLQIRFSEGRLKVAKRWEQVESSAQLIRTCLLAVF